MNQKQIGRVALVAVLVAVLGFAYAELFGGTTREDSREWPENIDWEPELDK